MGLSIFSIPCSGDCEGPLNIGDRRYAVTNSEHSIDEVLFVTWCKRLYDFCWVFRSNRHDRTWDQKPSLVPRCDRQPEVIQKRGEDSERIEGGSPLVKSA